MADFYPKLFSPGRIGALVVPNRVVMAPMATSFPNVLGEVTEWMANYYARRARGGVGLIIVENANVDYPDGISGTTQLRVDKDRYIPALSRLVRTIQAEGACCALQINHAGAVALKAEAEGGHPVAPSEGPDGLYRMSPRILAVEDIRIIVDRFAQAALRAQKAGFDAVEIHGAHAYLIAQFLSPLTNRRTDEYGGDTISRSRFASEVIAAVKRYVGPDYPVIFRLGAHEFLDGGIDTDESSAIAVILADAGVDAIDLTVGTHYRLNRSMCAQLEPMAYTPGWRLDLVAKVKQHLNVPVIAVGNFREPEVAEKAIADAQVDFAAIGRALIADPDWAEKSRRGRAGDIRRCISCNEGCVRKRLFEDRPVSCTVNPVVGWEGRGLCGPADRPIGLLVVGGGPAGCAAAINARERGHRVLLLERNPELGGNCLLGSQLPDKEKLGWVVDYQRERLKNMDVDLRLSTPFSVELVAEIRPDFLILAIGAEPCLPAGIEMNGSDPLHAEDVIRNCMSWSKAQLVVIGAGALGCELALSLAQADNDVTILEVLDRPVRDVEPINRFDLLDRLDVEKRVRIVTRFSIQKAGDYEVQGLKLDGGRRVFRADAVIWAAGYQPRQLEGISGFDFPEMRIRRIGDCLRPRNVFHAVQDGFWLGAKIRSIE